MLGFQIFKRQGIDPAHLTEVAKLFGRFSRTMQTKAWVDEDMNHYKQFCAQTRMEIRFLLFELPFICFLCFVLRMGQIDTILSQFSVYNILNFYGALGSV